MVRISDILANPLVDAESHLDLERVERYAELLEALPPVAVFKTPEGLLLADGYHRVWAAKTRGRMTVEADVREGSRADALRYAAAVAEGERGISEGEAIEHIRRHSGERWGGPV